jgi:hypothetical protein
MKKVLYIILGLIVLYFILALFGPKEVKAERSIVIHAPLETVKEKLGDFKYFHDTWSPWTKRDPKMTTEYSGTPGQPGHMHRWAGNRDVGAGEMELAEYSGDTIIQKLRFEGQPESKAWYIVKKEGEATVVTWGLGFKVGFMRRTPMLFINMDKMMGKDFEEGLQNLKASIEGEKAAAALHYEIDEQKWDEKTFISTKREKIRGDQCGPFLANNLPKIFADIGKSGLEPAMAPSMIFYSWDEKTMMTDCQACIAVKTDDKKAKEKVEKLTGWEKCVVPASKVLHIAYYGDYGKTMDAHVAMENRIKEKGFKKDIVIEEYVTDPGVEKDTTKWLTNIYYVVK